MPQSMRLCCNWMLAVAVAVLAGCATGPRTPAPVVDRSQDMRPQQPSPPAAAVQPVRPPSAPVTLEVAPAPSKPGTYTVKPGDTLVRIALDSGLNWRDLARWNGIENANLIEVGQVLRTTQPAGAAPGELTPMRPMTPASAAAAPAPQPAASDSRVAALTPAPSAQPAPSGAAPKSSDAEDDVPWAWPTAGAPSVLAGFDETRNKGLDIAGKAGDPVLASADGRVVYAGAGLRGYGNLIILKHNNTYLTAYAHNQSLLVKEDQTVRKGQKIAEMGNSDADRVKLHFEIRKQGKPVDPSKYLPR